MHTRRAYSGNDSHIMIHMHTVKHTYTHARMRARAHTHRLTLHAQTPHTCTHTQNTQTRAHLRSHSLHIRMHWRRSVCVCTRTEIIVLIYVERVWKRRIFSNSCAVKINTFVWKWFLLLLCNMIINYNSFTYSGWARVDTWSCSVNGYNWFLIWTCSQPRRSQHTRTRHQITLINK